MRGDPQAATGVSPLSVALVDAEDCFQGASSPLPVVAEGLSPTGGKGSRALPRTGCDGSISTAWQWGWRGGPRVTPLLVRGSLGDPTAARARGSRRALTFLFFQPSGWKTAP